MNRCLILLLTMFLSAGASWAGETVPDMRKTTWQDIFSDVIGHYPMQCSEVEENEDVYKNRLSQPKDWLFSIGLQRYLMSHTSYEIGNPDPPFQKPLSRLEFPLNTWWLDFELRRTCPRWSIGGRAGLSVARNVDGRFKDSDWERTVTPDTKTTYSESAMRAEQNYHFRGDIDVNISDWLGLPPSLEIRPLFAFQFQRLNLMAHDGVQWTTGAYNDEDDEMNLDGSINATALPGDTIHFRQDYYLYQIGLRGSYDFRLNKYLTIRPHGEADWGPAVGFNEDHHLMRTGDLFGYIKSSGNSLYCSAGVDMIIAKAITAGIIMDYLWIRTTGETRHYNAPTGENQKWTDGVEVWSDQTSLIAHLSFAF